MNPFTHWDEARNAGVKALRTLAEEKRVFEKAVLVDDIYGMIRVVIWPTSTASHDAEQLARDTLASVTGAFWAGDVWVAPGRTRAEKTLYESAWREGRPVSDKVRVSERTRSKSCWFTDLTTPPWPLESKAGRPQTAIIVFYSFKGGVGRTTALAATAIQLAQRGKRVAVIDLDIEAPGAGLLLAPPEIASRARWGVVDYFLEQPRGATDIRDYYHSVPYPRVVGTGAIDVIPAGRLNSDYMQKLGRLDIEAGAEERSEVLDTLLRALRTELKADYILLDSRAGLSEISGVTLSGVAHLQVIVATGSEQTWDGLGLVLQRVGGARVREGKPQAECVIVQGMTPANRELRELSERRFAESSYDSFVAHYYAQDAEDDEDKLWYVRDAGSGDAPDVPVSLPYRESLASFRSIEEIADDVARSTEYGALTERILRKLRRD
jgi:cellulose biosynthesis protein BcsQ